MATFLHNLMEGLRGREKFLEQKMSDIIAQKKSKSPYEEQYNSLQKEIDDFKNKIADLQETGRDYDEHFERKIKDDHQRLEVKIDAWAISSPDDTAD